MTVLSSKSIVLVLLFSLLAAACGSSFGPPPECATGLGGTADEAKFAQYFSSMDLVSQTTGQTGTPADNGVAFAVSEPLVIQVGNTAGVSVRACVQFFNGNTIAFDQTSTLPVGQSEIVLGAFPGKGNYVVRMIVDGVLVKNLPFTLQ